MSRLTLNIVFFVWIQHSLCAFDPIDLHENGRSGSSLSDIVQKKIDSEHVTFDDEKTSKEGSAGYDGGKSRFNLQREENKSYNDQDTARKEYDKGRKSLGESKALDQGKNSFEKYGGGYYKKGHHKTGFSNNYHKDESGNNSSFYEDSDDEKGHRSSENSGGYYGQKSQDSFRDGERDASYTERDRAHQGIHDNRENSDNYRGYSGRRNNNRYNDDRRNYFQDGTGRYYNRNGKGNYYQGEEFYPLIRRNKEDTPSFEYSRYHVDTLPRDYYKEDPYVSSYSRDYRYFPNHGKIYERENYYPDKGYYHRDFQDDVNDNRYNDKYRRDYNNEYYRY